MKLLNVIKQLSGPSFGLLGICIAAPVAAQSYDGVLARYTTGGALDTTFATGGKYISTGSGDDVINDVDRDSNGKFVTCGFYTTGTGTYQFMALRINLWAFS